MLYVYRKEIGFKHMFISDIFLLINSLCVCSYSCNSHYEMKLLEEYYVSGGKYSRKEKGSIVKISDTVDNGKAKEFLKIIIYIFYTETLTLLLFEFFKMAKIITLEILL